MESAHESHDEDGEHAWEEVFESVCVLHRQSIAIPHSIHITESRHLHRTPSHSIALTHSITLHRKNPRQKDQSQSDAFPHIQPQLEKSVSKQKKSKTFQSYLSIPTQKKSASIRQIRSICVKKINRKAMHSHSYNQHKKNPCQSVKSAQSASKQKRAKRFNHNPLKPNQKNLRENNKEQSD